MQRCPSAEDELAPRLYSFYCAALTALQRAQVPFLVGGAYALAHHTGIVRHTKDFDIFTRPRDCERVLGVLSAAGYRTEITDPRWLAKAFSGEDFVDVIFSSGNAIAEVDDVWFEHAIDAKVLGLHVQVCPPEETIWSKAFVMERERYDGADIAHLLRAYGRRLDWDRVLERFGPHWRVLLSHLILFGYIYPSEQGRIPPSVMETLLGRVRDEVQHPPKTGKLCQGTLLSKAQYAIDIDRWGYRDARLPPSPGKAGSRSAASRRRGSRSSTATGGDATMAPCRCAVCGQAFESEDELQEHEQTCKATACPA